MAAYGFAIFTGAFLLFQLQPLIAKYLLPWFGGAPAVWTTCLLFFQVALLAGYAYAHVSTRWLKPKAQVLLHLALLAAALATLPITPGDSWKPHGIGDPRLRILALLTVSLGLPYLALSATAPLLQHWFTKTRPGVSPFRLYALSNAGSLLALLSYPTLFETTFTRTAQATVWSIGLGLYTVACVVCAWQLLRPKSKEQGLKSVSGPALPSVVPDHKASGKTENEAPGVAGRSALATRHPSLFDRLLWLLLPACASVLLLAVTHKICQDVAVIALLWVLPLAIYLLSFIICFDRPGWYRRSWFGGALLVALAAMSATLAGVWALSVPLQILVYTVGLFVCCMVCHGETCRLRPDPSHLTAFYLMLAAGGAAGGVFVGLLAPQIFSDYFELHWGLLVCGLLFLVVWRRERETGMTWGLACMALAAVAIFSWADARRYAAVRVYRNRTFYGVLSVNRHADPALSQVELLHGSVVHGMQFLDPSRAGFPTLYYSPESGIGRALEILPAAPRRVGVAGLGAGTLAAYARPGDHFRFYEINPDVERVARTYFTYLGRARGEVSVALGDARLSLENEPPQNFDLLALDAFNSDSIPIHLLTREAFQVYQRHLKTNGLIAVHVSNTSLNLEPVVLNLAREFGFQAVVLDQLESNERLGVLPCTWVVLSRSPTLASAPKLSTLIRPAAETGFTVPLWTDDFSGLFPVLRWRELLGREPTRALGIVRAVQVAAALTNQLEVTAAMIGFRETLKRDSNSVPALNNLACILATAADPELRNGAEAVKLAERACALTQYGSTTPLMTLAAAYAEAGRFDEAIATSEKATALAEANGEEVLLKRNRQLLQLYRRREAYHQKQ
jgi:hypothetical protein